MIMENLPWLTKLDMLKILISGIALVVLVVFYICLTLWGKWEERKIRKYGKSSTKHRT